MNEKVKELGLKDTHFKNPDGYDTEGQYTTAYDMGIISLKAIKKDIIREITEKDKARNIFLSGEDVTWKSTNKLVVNGSGVFYKYAIGLKTGSSSLAGSCLVSAAEDEDKQFISVIMNSTASGRWEDSITLLKYGMEH
jgi:D-alanyl-D-alanine carboxypeptidase (penicillin-binding protein 5/6)